MWPNLSMSVVTVMLVMLCRAGSGAAATEHCTSVVVVV